jgi:hypothetical protein
MCWLVACPHQKINIYGADAPGAGSNFLRATRMLFKEPNHLARDSSSGAHSRYDLSSAIIWRQNFFERERGSTSAASMT